MEMLRYKDAIQTCGSLHRLQKALKDKTMFKIQDGIYCQNPNPPQAAVVCFAYPNAIVTMLSAFYYHGLTDVVPEDLDVAIPSSSRPPKDQKVRVHYSPKGFHEQGISSQTRHGFAFRIYNKERMLIELLRHKDALPYDLYKEVLSHYRTIIDTLDLRLIEEMLQNAPKRRLIWRRLEEEVL